MTPWPASAAIRSLTAARHPSGATTSATPTACMTGRPPTARTATRAVEPTPNHWCAGLSRVNQWRATSAPAAPGGRPITAVAVW